MKKTTILLMLLCMSLLTAHAQEAQLRLPQFFADGMVLQRGVKIPVWGWGKAGDPVSVTLDGKTVKTRVQPDGTWKAYLPKFTAGGPYELVVVEKTSKSSAAVKKVENVLIGDVYLCSGQSNMELPVRRCMDRVRPLVEHYTNDQVRYLKLPQQYNYVRPNDDVRILPWQNLTPQNSGEVSAICYFMARHLQEQTGVPVGIINSSVGGTKVQAWMPREVLATFDGYPEELARRKYHQTDWPDSIRRVENQAINEWERQMAATDTVLHRWRTEGYDCNAWPTVPMFSDWSHRRNGSYWFAPQLAGKPALLRFGAMCDADSIFVNGTFVGNTTYQYPPRNYTVAEGILREGDNQVVVHLMSQQGSAGFVSGKQYQLEVDGQVFPLSPDLHMAVGCVMPERPTSTYFVDTPTGLYNAMIYPLRDYPLSGMLWYQGESNQGETPVYAPMLEAMVQSWRQQFRTDFPVVIVQLPSYMGTHEQPFESGWTRIRQQQSLAAQRIPKAALVPTFDTGEFNDIHPQDKDISGRRAALAMLRLTRGLQTPESDVPMPVSARVEGDRLLLTFQHVGTGLTVQGDAVKNLAIRVDDRYQWATATVTAPDAVSIQLPSGIHLPTAVRYGWDDFLQPSLFTREGMPVPQFEIAVP